MQLNLPVNREFDIISIGECMVEFFPLEPFSPCQDDADLNKKHFVMSFGGDTLNVIVSAGRLGAKTGYITKVGNDIFGDYLLQCFKREKIDISCIKQSSASTGIYFIINLPDNNHKFIYYRKNSSASFLTYHDIDINYLLKAKIIHTSGITQAISRSCEELIKRTLKKAKKYNCITSYDANLRVDLCSLDKAKKNFLEILDYVDIIFLNISYEAENLLGLNEPEEICNYLHLKGIKIIVLKMDKNGCIVSYNNKAKKIYSYNSTSSSTKKIKVIDTSGAGDAFAGAFLYSLCNNLSPYSCAKVGLNVALITITKQGTVSSFEFCKDKRLFV